MSQQSKEAGQAQYFNLFVEGVGYLNRVRTVKPKKGQEFLACTVSAMRGNANDVNYTRFDCKVAGSDAQKIVKRLEADVNAEKPVIIGFKIADIYPEMFTFEKGDRKGEQGINLKGRLLRIKFAKVSGQSIELPEQSDSKEPEREAA